MAPCYRGTRPPNLLILLYRDAISFTVSGEWK
jgi:hypothetical protein